MNDNNLSGLYESKLLHERILALKQSSISLYTNFYCKHYHYLRSSKYSDTFLLLLNFAVLALQIFKETLSEKPRKVSSKIVVVYHFLQHLNLTEHSSFLDHIFLTAKVAFKATISTANSALLHDLLRNRQIKCSSRCTGIVRNNPAQLTQLRSVTTSTRWTRKEKQRKTKKRNTRHLISDLLFRKRPTDDG